MKFMKTIFFWKCLDNKLNFRDFKNKSSVEELGWDFKSLWRETYSEQMGGMRSKAITLNLPDGLKKYIIDTEV